jgi:hypothetical protein
MVQKLKLEDPNYHHFTTYNSFSSSPGDRGKRRIHYSMAFLYLILHGSLYMLRLLGTTHTPEGPEAKTHDYSHGLVAGGTGSEYCASVGYA